LSLFGVDGRCRLSMYVCACVCSGAPRRIDVQSSAVVVVCTSLPYFSRSGATDVARQALCAPGLFGTALVAGEWGTCVGKWCVALHLYRSSDHLRCASFTCLQIGSWTRSGAMLSLQCSERAQVPWSSALVRQWRPLCQARCDGMLTLSRATTALTAKRWALTLTECAREKLSRRARIPWKLQLQCRVFRRQ
jgi:hypothetical protein